MEWEEEGTKKGKNRPFSVPSFILVVGFQELNLRVFFGWLLLG
jgi:hypothetical protein